MTTQVQEDIITRINLAAVDVRTEFEGQNAQLAAKDYTIAQLELGINPVMQVQINDLQSQVSERQALVAQLTLDKNELATSLAGVSAERDSLAAEIARLNNGIDEVQGQTH